MSSKKLLSPLLVFLFVVWKGLPVFSQGCIALGQTPATAFPVCGSATFTQKSVSPCVNGRVIAPCSSGTGNIYEDLNPYWYKFTCFVGGTLALTIDPKNDADDYDWQIFDVTGHDPSDVYTNAHLLVACNWSGLHGITGTKSTAASLTECGSTGTFDPPIFSKLPTLIQGHNYLLLISHFTGDQQSGYDLSFIGGTASITDTVPPTFKDIRPICDGSRIRVILNKKMKCNSLAADGSDFSISPAVAQVIGATGNSCKTGFDMDTVTLTLSSGFVPGTYAVVAKNGQDQNTLLDNCGIQIPVGTSMPFVIMPPQPTPFDSLTPPTCAPDVLQVVFSKKIKCSSIAANGSDFTMSGTSVVTVVSANGKCDADGQTDVILVHLSAPIETAGNYQIRLGNGIDGNTIIDECGLTTPLSAPIPFTTKDTVTADFNNQLHLGCLQDTIDLFYPSKNGVDQWKWIFDDIDTSHLQNPERRYNIFGDKKVELMVSNGFCSDTNTAVISLDNAIHAAFEAPNILCPGDAAVLRNHTIGYVSSWDWDLGDGTFSMDSLPPDHLYPLAGAERKYAITLIITNNLGCKDTAARGIVVLKSCYIAVPSAFTPNGDGLNDYLYPLNAYKADDMEFRVYNRWGQLLYTSRDWLSKWDGAVGGSPQPPGAYVWSLQYTDRDTHRKVYQKGTTILIR
jgi:gliding motility-associated-like protein